MFDRIDKLPSGCWRWRGAHTRGRPVVHRRSISKSNLYVHRLLWQEENGPVPEGKELHHECLNEWCCNPAHCVPLTHAEHKKLHRGTHCQRGHELTPENRRKPRGDCLVCHRLRAREARHHKQRHRDGGNVGV